MKIVIYLYCYDAFLFKNASAFLLRDLCYTMHSILLHVTSYYLFRKSGRNPRSLNRRVLYWLFVSNLQFYKRSTKPVSQPALCCILILIISLIFFLYQLSLFLFFFLTLFILFPDKWTLINHKVRLDNWINSFPNHGQSINIYDHTNPLLQVCWWL